MNINLSDHPFKHPANDRLTDERLIRVRGALQRTLTAAKTASTGTMSPPMR